MSGVEPSVRIRLGRPDEADRLSSLARAAKASWDYPAEWIEGWADELRIDAARLEAGDVFVADVDDEPAGWVVVGEGPEGPEIAHLWVDPHHQGRGLGRALLEAARREGARRGWPVLRVESDPHALGFYEWAGARVVGRIPAPVDGVERWLPVLELDTGPPVAVEPADPAAARLVELSEIDDRLAVAQGRTRRRLLVAGGMTLVGPVNFLIPLDP